MRSPGERRRLWIVALGALLGGSLFLNWILLRQVWWYYVQVNELHLNPVGLDFYPSGDPRDSVDPDLTSVVMLGDSRVAGWSGSHMPGFVFVNRGLGAQTSRQVLLRVEQHVAPLNPDIVLVQVGINDLKTIPLFPEQEAAIVARCKENIRQIVDRCMDLGAKVILTTLFPVGKPPLGRRLFWSDAVAESVREVNAYLWSLEREGVIVFDAYAILVGPDGLIKPAYGEDLLHLTEAGYEALNEALAPVLAELE